MNAPTQQNPEIGKTVLAGGIRTNLHDMGSGNPVLLIHGSGPGVSAWANWRLSFPVLSQKFRVIAPDIVGFGFTERPAGISYTLDNWVKHAISLLDALGLDKVDLVGNSFGGALLLALAVRHPDRVKRLVLMGSAGTSFKLTPALDEAWGYQPSIENMRRLLDSLPMTARWSPTNWPSCVMKRPCAPACRKPTLPCSRRHANAGSNRWPVRKTRCGRSPTRP